MVHAPILLQQHDGHLSIHTSNLLVTSSLKCEALLSLTPGKLVYSLSRHVPICIDLVTLATGGLMGWEIVYPRPTGSCLVLRTRATFLLQLEIPLKSRRIPSALSPK